MNQNHYPAPKLSVSNFKRVVNQLIQPHQEMIAEAALQFKNKMSEYRSKSQPRNSDQPHLPIVINRRSPSLLSEMSMQFEQQSYPTDDAIAKPINPKTYQLPQWQSSIKPSFSNYIHLTKHYEQLFLAKNYLKKNTKDFYDFKVDQKKMLTKIFNQIRTQENAVDFETVITFFDKCQLFYLCYNIKPNQLIDLLKDSAHQYSNKLTYLQFLNVFFIDRPNLTSLYDNESIKIAKQCILNEEGWKELKLIFSTLDTFGNQTISMAPFLFKIKNNYSNRQLINEPAIQYPQINRTLPLKKIIFNLENRYKFQDDITWPEIESIIRNFKYISQPTIDIIYKRMIEQGKITRFSNYFMINNQIIEEIKYIFNRCPKYCEYFIKTRFLCNELLQSYKIKKYLKEAIVRIIQVGHGEKATTLEDQIRLISKEAESYIDLDELLEYFTIKGPINTRADVQIDFNQTDSEDEETVRFDRLRQVRSVERLHSFKKGKKYPKPIRHLTVCEEFKLSSTNKQAIMDRKTREWKEAKDREAEFELNNKFKANPIPAELNPERHRLWVQQMEQAKNMKRQLFLKKKEEQNHIYNYLKANTKLFTTKERLKTQPTQEKYKFTPKPIPWHIVEVNLLQNINEQKNLRKKKILTDNKIRILREWRKLPNVMQNDQDLTQNDSLDNEPNSSQHSSSLQTQMKRMKKNPIKEVPDFKRLHAQFEEQLSKKKKKFVPTVPVAPAFTTIKRKHVSFENKKTNRIQSLQPRQKSSAKHKTSVQTCITKHHAPIPITKKYLGMVEFTQQKLQERQLQRIRQEDQQRQRKNKQYNFSKFMHKKLNQSLHKTVSLTNLTKNKVKKLNHEWVILRKQNQEELYQMYSRVMARPFLFENISEVEKNPQIVTKNTLTKVKAKPNLWKRPKEAKHVHQSPLKEFDPEQQSPLNHEEQHHQYQYEPQSQSQKSRNKAYLMNQSF